MACESIHDSLPSVEFITDTQQLPQLFAHELSIVLLDSEGDVFCLWRQCASITAVGFDINECIRRP